MAVYTWNNDLFDLFHWVKCTTQQWNFSRGGSCRSGVSGGGRIQHMSESLWGVQLLAQATMGWDNGTSWRLPLGSCPSGRGNKKQLRGVLCWYSQCMGACIRTNIVDPWTTLMPNVSSSWRVGWFSRFTCIGDGNTGGPFSAEFRQSRFAQMTEKYSVPEGQVRDQQRCEKLNWKVHWVATIPLTVIRQLYIDVALRYT